MEEQKYQIGDIVEVVWDDYNNDVRIAKIVSIGIYEKNPNKYTYGICFNLNGVIADKQLLTIGKGVNLSRWINKKVIIS